MPLPRSDEFSNALLRWYDARKRDLPWRRTRDPYRIWVSEIMLQQTRVETVIPYYERFLDRFPTARALGAATEEEVLSQWSGLGYYSRARNLWRGAAVVCDRFDGEFPLDREKALELPGIGRYTSAAIVSIAADHPHAVVDGNVARVLARLYALEPPADRSIPRLEAIAQSLLSTTRPGDHNQAMMELGATICTPRAPRCPSCPVQSTCAMTTPNQDPESFPRPVPRKEPIQLELAILLLRDSHGRLLLERGRWNLIPHLWIPPVLEIRNEFSSAAALNGQVPIKTPTDARHSSAADLNGEAPIKTAIEAWRSFASSSSRVEDLQPLGSFRHSITHHRIRFGVWGGRVVHAPRSADHQFVSDEELASIGLSSVALKALRLEIAERRQPKLL